MLLERRVAHLPRKTPGVMELDNAQRRFQRFKRARMLEHTRKLVVDPEERVRLNSPEERAKAKSLFLGAVARGSAKSISDGQFRNRFVMILRRLGKRDLNAPVSRAEFDAMRIRLKNYRGKRPEALYGMLTVCGFKMEFQMPGAEVL